MRLRWIHRRTPTKPRTDQHSLGFGLKVGYWPCLRAPFVAIYAGSHIFEVWYGHASYLYGSNRV